MTNQPKITVIIPSYNRPNLIGRAIKSVLNQTYHNFELVIVDSSPDNKTEEVVKGFNDERIKYIHNERKTILSIGKNQGVRESDQNSKYVPTPRPKRHRRSFGCSGSRTGRIARQQ